MFTRNRPSVVRVLPFFLLCCQACLIGFGADAPEAGQGRRILSDTGVRSGLIVHLGCGDGKLTAALRATDGLLVHGLDADAKNVAKSREHVRSLGMYGNVSVQQLSGARLPYADNIVNLLVTEDLGNVTMGEVMRVLCPLGVAYVKTEGRWGKTVKRWPDNIDQWTHFLHGPDGNAVSRDTEVGKPESLRWIADPKFSRHHDEVLTTSAMVTGNGRIFSIIDESPRSTFHEHMGGKYHLIARDAFNGLLLWKKPIADWGWKSWGSRHNVRFGQPIQLPKRMVVDGDRLYVTLGWNAPVSVIDAQSGDVIKSFEQSGLADEILISDGRMILSVYQQPIRPAQGPDAPKTPAWPSRRQGEGKTSQRQEERPRFRPATVIGKKILAIALDSGRMLWETDWLDGLTARYDAVTPQTHLELTVKAGRVFAVTKDEIVCFSFEDGRQLWKRSRPEHPGHRMGLGVYMSDNCTVLADEERLYVAQPVGKLGNSFHTVPCDLYAYDAQSGEQLWKLERKIGSFAWGIHADVFLIGGMLWSHEHHESDMRGANPLGQDSIAYALVAIDRKTGVIRRRIDTRQIFNIPHHARCYRNKATERFVLTARRGTELIDLETGVGHVNHWLRGECRFGIMPANGLLYLPPNPCACHARIKVDGFLAIAEGAPPASDSSSRLVKGPAYGEVESFDASETDWPMHRGNARRQGCTEQAISAKLEPAWVFDADDSITQATCVGQQVFVACKNSHQVKALCLTDGKPLWSFTANGRIDSPPTFCRGYLLFGSADGWVYCLRAQDGVLVWRFRAAPVSQLIIAHQQLESAWPVHGSVLVLEDVAYVAAGRSSYLDGGIHAFALDVATGRVLRARHIRSTYEDTKLAPSAQAYDAVGALNHLLVSDGKTVYLQNKPLFSDTNTSTQVAPAKPFLMATCGMLDGSMFSRFGWAFVGASWATGNQIVHDDRQLYITRATNNFNRSAVFVAGSGYALMQAEFPARIETYAQFDKNAFGSLGYRSGKVAASWNCKIPIRGQAMLLAPNALLVAGFPDEVPEDAPYAAFEGRLGGKLVAFQRETGKMLSEFTLDAPPVWDGLSLAAGRVFVAQENGKLVCLQERPSGQNTEPTRNLAPNRAFVVPKPRNLSRTRLPTSSPG